MKSNSTAKNNFKAMLLADFWAKYVYIYNSAGAVAIRTFLPLSSTYMTKWLFFQYIKTKHSNKLDCEANLKWVICHKVMS